MTTYPPIPSKRARYLQLGLYVMLMIGLLVLNLVTYSGHLWVVYPALGWGMALLFQYTAYCHEQQKAAPQQLAAGRAADWMPRKPQRMRRRAFGDYEAHEFV